MTSHADFLCVIIRMLFIYHHFKFEIDKKIRTSLNQRLKLPIIEGQTDLNCSKASIFKNSKKFSESFDKTSVII